MVSRYIKQVDGEELQPDQAAKHAHKKEGEPHEQLVRSPLQLGRWGVVVRSDVSCAKKNGSYDTAVGQIFS